MGRRQVGRGAHLYHGYKNTENKPAKVMVSDAVPTGTEFVEFTGDHKDVGSKDRDGNLTWTLTDVPAGEEGTVQLRSA